MLFILACVLLMGSAAPGRAAELIMIEQRACPYCERWHADIGSIYPKTREGKRAPLRIVDIHEHIPDDVAKLAPGRFTPTFILVDKGVEIGRLRGYPGEELFWWHISALMAKLGDVADHSGPDKQSPDMRSNAGTGS